MISLDLLRSVIIKESFFQKPPFQWRPLSCAFVHSPALTLSFLHILLIFFLQLLPTFFFLFSLLFIFFPIVLIGLLSCFVLFFSLPCWFVIGCGLFSGIMCHQPDFWCLACSWRLSLVSGSELCPLRPSTCWQTAQEYFLGRYCPPHVWPHIFPLRNLLMYCISSHLYNTIVCLHKLEVTFDPH